MARKTTVELVDDLTGAKAEETVTFGLDGVAYEIDLSKENADNLRSALEGWAGKARRVGGRKQRGTGSASAIGSSDAPKIREWAKENGIDVPDRGRIPADVRERYEEAQTAPEPKSETKPAEKKSDKKSEDKDAMADA